MSHLLWPLCMTILFNILLHVLALPSVSILTLENAATRRYMQCPPRCTLQIPAMATKFLFRTKHAARASYIFHGEFCIFSSRTQRVKRKYFNRQPSREDFESQRLLGRNEEETSAQERKPNKRPLVIPNITAVNGWQ